MEKQGLTESFSQSRRSYERFTSGKQRRALNTCGNVLLAIACMLLVVGVYLLFTPDRLVQTPPSMSPFSSICNEITWETQPLDRRAFCDFIFQFSKQYANASEMERRFQIFRRNMLMIHEHNAKQSSEDAALLGVTRFSDLEDAELRQFIAEAEFDSQPHGGKATVALMESSLLVAPRSVDWRRKGIVTPVKNQGQCGSCWAFAVVAAVESQYALNVMNQTKPPQLALALSEQQLLDCDLSDNACNGGNRYNAFSYVKQEGLVPESVYPYKARRQLSCQIQPKAKRVYVGSIHALSSNEETIAQWVAANGPVTFGMAVTREMFHYKRGVFSPSMEDCTLHSVGSHAMAVVGYDVTPAGTPYWILKNSWGAAYGVNGGYLHMLRGSDSCGLARQVYTALID